MSFSSSLKMGSNGHDSFVVLQHIMEDGEVHLIHIGYH